MYADQDSSNETHPCCRPVGRTRKFSELNAASCFICCQLFWKSGAVVSTGLHPNTRRYSSCQTVNTRSRGEKNISKQLPIQVSTQYLYLRDYKRAKFKCWIESYWLLNFLIKAHFRRGSTPASTILQKSVRFFIINIFLIRKNFPLQGFIRG